MRAHTKASNTNNVLEHKRDAYGFAVRPQHLQRYREYSKIYKEEEEERSECWNSFLKRQAESSQGLANGLHSGDTKDEILPDSAKVDADKETNGSETCSDVIKRAHKVQIWTEVRPSLRSIEEMMSIKVKKKPLQDEASEKLSNNEDSKPTKNTTDEDSEDEFYDMERSDPIQDPNSADSTVITSTSNIEENSSDYQWREELEVLVRGGVPMALRGELWQAFVGVKARRVENYYRDLLVETQEENNDANLSNGDSKDGSDHATITEKWKAQIEKDLPRTFPSHPALDENGRNALRRILTTYARHNPSVGYCQAMNFFAALLLLLMPEENAFWALVAILDDYFEGYYSEEMIESQVDQLVFEELVRERFPKLVNHLDFLGVQVTWVTGPWFLSIFMNMLPWESVLRVWDVLLFEGNRVMLFRTALALMELYGPALVTTKDAGDAVTLLQSLAGSTFDSSQLVLTACMGYQNVSEKRLEELRNKHRSAVIAAVEERIKGLQGWRDSQGLATKLYNFNKNSTKWSEGNLSRSQSSSSAADSEPPDLQDQVVWLKAEVCKLIEEKRSALLRAEELEIALVEMVTQDNRRELSAKVEELDLQLSDLKRVLEDKKEQESAMLKVLMRVEQEQRVTEDARRYAEQDAEAQRYAAKILQEKYEDAMASLADMEKRAVMAESMLEATLQYQSSQPKTIHSPKSSHNKSEEPPKRTGLLSRPFWRDRNKPDESKHETKHDDADLPHPPE